MKLKIKNKVDLNSLRNVSDKIAFDSSTSSDVGWNYDDFNINPITRELTIGCGDDYYFEEQQEKALLLYDLIKMGLVEKVEG